MYNYKLSYTTKFSVNKLHGHYLRNSFYVNSTKNKTEVVPRRTN